MKRLWIVGVLAGVTAFGTVSSFSRPVLAAENAKVQDLRSQVMKIDDEIQAERDKFNDRKEKMKQGSPEEVKLAEEHGKTIHELQARRAALVKEVVGARGPHNATALKEELLSIDERIKEENTLHEKKLIELKGNTTAVGYENTRHEARLKALEAHRAQLNGDITDFGGDKKIASADLQTKLADVTSQIKTEDDRHEQAVKDININKHRIGQQLSAKGIAPAQAADLRGQMGVQEQALGDENRSHQATEELLLSRKSHIESLLATGAK